VIVADTNLIAYAAIPGPQSALADAVRRRDSHWVAPSLWQDEFLNVLANHVRVGRMTADGAADTFALAGPLVRPSPVAMDPLAVLRLVASSRCSAYDCQYVALAHALGVQLVTEDRALLAAFPSTAISMKDFVSAP
jgi:predicted nucleic acid-binding protein